jgi:hypothetical protein
LRYGILSCMTPLAHLAIGFAIVFVDIRTDSGFDVVIDPLGWLAIIFALGRLPHARERFTFASRAAYAGLLVSAIEVLPLEIPASLVSAAHVAAESAFVFGVCTGMIRTLAPPQPGQRPQGKAAQADLVRWSHVGFSIILIILLTLSFFLNAPLGSFEVLTTLLPLLLISLWFLSIVFNLRTDPHFGGA